MLFALCSFFAGLQGIEGQNDALVCTFVGSGRDIVYTVRCRAGRTVLFESPAEIDRYLLGDPAGWLASRQGRSLWLQPKQAGIQCSLVIVCRREGGPPLCFCFGLCEAGSDSSEEFWEKVVILTERGGGR